jgi:hypothetical protein
MASIRARAVADATTELEPAARIRALANTVRRPGSFAQAQRAYADLSERYTALREEERGLIARMLAEGGETANGSGPLIARIKQVDAELTTCSDSIREALQTLLEAREPFAKAVAEALAPERAAAGRRGLRAAMELVAEFDVLDAIDREISSVGGSSQHPMQGYRGALEPILARLRRLAIG